MTIKKKTLYRYQCDQCKQRYPETDNLEEAQIDQREHEAQDHGAQRSGTDQDV